MSSRQEKYFCRESSAGGAPWAKLQTPQTSGELQSSRNPNSRASKPHPFFLSSVFAHFSVLLSWWSHNGWWTVKWMSDFPIFPQSIRQLHHLPPLLTMSRPYCTRVSIGKVLKLVIFGPRPLRSLILWEKHSIGSMYFSSYIFSIDFI